MPIMVGSMVAGSRHCAVAVTENLNVVAKPHGREREKLGLSWDFETSVSTLTPVTQQGYISESFPKEFHQLGTKNSNI